MGHLGQGAAACFGEDTENMNRERAETYLWQLAQAELRRARTLPAALFRTRQDTARDPRGALPLAKAAEGRLSLRRGRCLSAIGA